MRTTDTLDFASNAPSDSRGRSCQVDYARLLGYAAWGRLPAALRARFARDHARDVIYVGRMRVVTARFFGRMLATIGRLIGEPLAPFVGTDVAAYVRVYVEPRGGTVWERAYHFPGRPTRLIRSAKRLDRDGALLECLGAGLYMRLLVSERDGALEFRSIDYFWHVLGLRIPLPRRWLIGETRVTHCDKGNGRFRFTLTIQHPLFGRIVHQDGVFADQENHP